ncbi:germacrene A synthase short form-like [Cynara cardunculus var. scolymus]|uniref:germacrene A synthase short form-like n=1 Tax=Cynara cardunculus var. scolymus TaxID=59895 RepID=UPI000D629977|nr:germacrene A synthase short form-like [Cynara cardunculus var. scolymus]
MEANTKTSMEPFRPLANFPPSIWGDRFLYFSVDNSELEAYAQAMEEPKEEVRRLIINPTMDPNATLSLIYSVYRLGLTYLFSEEIDGQLVTFYCIFVKLIWQTDLLLVTRHADVFNKFKDQCSGKFEECNNIDARGMLNFYECAHLGINGEHILDEALVFTKTQLKRIVNNLEGNLAEQVKHALMRPFHRGMPMVEARLYFSNYKEECSRYDSLRKLGCAHFNYLRLLQKKELYIVSKWWKDRDFQRITPYARDRVPELYLWMLVLFFEPQYSEARIITTKIAVLVLVLDDTCDAYATIEEIRLLTHAINRSEFNALEQLPEYIKPFYKILLNVYAELEMQDGRSHFINAAKQAFQELARGYLIEAEWTHSGEVPSFEEYVKNGLTTSTYNVLSKSSLIGMGEIVSEEALAWHKGNPKILKASELIARLHDDVKTYQFERERGQSTTGVGAYMKTFRVSDEDVAIEEIMKMIESAWKDIKEGCLKPREVSMDVIAPILNLARMIDVVYKHDDGFTFPEKALKVYITLLFVDSAPVY